MKKNCVICDAKFEAQTNAKACGGKCRRLRKLEMERIRFKLPENKKKQREKQRKYRQENVKRCHRYDREYRQRPEVKARRKKYEQRPEVKERIRQLQRERYQRPEVKERIRQLQRERYQRPEVKTRKKESHYTYTQKPEIKIKLKRYWSEYEQRPEVKKRRKERQLTPEYRKKQRERLRNNPRFRLACLTRSGIWRSLRMNGLRKTTPTFALLDYTFTQLISHFESQFTDGMSWDNMGQWHIDHIRPVSSFDFDSADHPDFKKCWALNNLQPLWATDNLSKSAKWDGVTNA